MLDIKSRLKKARSRLEEHRIIKLRAKPEDTIETLAQKVALSSQNNHVSATFKGREFHVEPYSESKDVMRAYIEQSEFLKDMPLEEMQDILGESVRIDDSYISVCKAEVTKKIISDYPQKISEVGTMHLLNAFLNSKDMALSNKTLRQALHNSAEEYMSGKQTFKPTIQNVMYLDQLEEYLFKSGQYRIGDIEARRQGVEQQMLSSARLNGLTDAELSFVGKTAKKYPDNPDAKRVFKQTSDIVMEKWTQAQKTPDH